MEREALFGALFMAYKEKRAMRASILQLYVKI